MLKLTYENKLKLNEILLRLSRADTRFDALFAYGNNAISNPIFKLMIPLLEVLKAQAVIDFDSGVNELYTFLNKHANPPA